MHGDALGRLIDRRDFGAESDVVLQVFVERARQEVQTADDLLHVLERAANDLAQLLYHGGVHVRLAEAHYPVQLDRALGEAARDEELAGRELIELLEQKVQRSNAAFFVALPELARCLVPKLSPGLALLVIREVEGQ